MGFNFRIHYDLDMSENKDYFEELIQTTEGTELSQMFGKACGKIGKKAFVAFYKEDMVFKLGRDNIPTLLEKYEGTKNWDPSGKGRAMKDWLQVPNKFKNDWADLFDQALEFNS